MYYLNLNVTLFNAHTGFFGRTYLGKSVRLALKEDDLSLFHESLEWVVFSTDNESLDTKAIVEVVLVEVDS